MDRWTAVGIGLDKQVVELGRTTDAWVALGSELRDEVAIVVGGAATVEQVGSSSVVGCIAKPLIDLAVGLHSMAELGALTAALEASGWSYRGDAGDAGGHVFVIETRHCHRVAHLHAVDLADPQWLNYLHFRDLLRTSAEARARYGAVKTQCAVDHPLDRSAYTAGKTAIVAELLGS